MNGSAVEGQDIVVYGDCVTTAAKTLADLVAERHADPRGIATAVNGTFVAAGVRAATALKAGDAVEIVSARQGG
mgnify:CR=1 FL=1